jgi:hypothetical protein
MNAEKIVEFINLLVEEAGEGRVSIEQISKIIDDLRHMAASLGILEEVDIRLDEFDIDIAAAVAVTDIE